jgi:hypothetical protein
LKHHQAVSAIFLSVIFASCVIETPVESDPPEPVAATIAEQPTEPETVAPPETKTVPQEEPVKETEPVIDPVTTDIPETPKPVALRPIPRYPAYILDQCGTLWGIPESLQGEYDKVHIIIETADGVPIPSSELDVFAIDGILYITRTHTVDGNPAIDYYRQEGEV